MDSRYLQMRQMAIDVQPAELGLPDPPDTPQLWGLIAEMGLPGGSMSLVAFREGSVSLYFSSGGGVIGAGEHEAVRAATLELLDAAVAAGPEFAPTDHPQLPQPATVAFVARTFKGLYRASALEALLRRREHPLHPLYCKTHDVISLIRMRSRE
jgi:hypothetical protein